MGMGMYSAIFMSGILEYSEKSWVIWRAVQTARPPVRAIKCAAGRQAPHTTDACAEVAAEVVTTEITHCHITTLRPRQNGRHFPYDVFKCIFLNVHISVKIFPKFLPKGPLNNIPALVQIIDWHRPGDKPLSEPMMVSLLTHICVTRLQWIKASKCPVSVAQGCRYLLCQLNLPHLVHKVFHVCWITQRCPKQAQKSTEPFRFCLCLWHIYIYIYIYIFPLIDYIFESAWHVCQYFCAY